MHAAICPLARGDGSRDDALAGGLHGLLGSQERGSFWRIGIVLRMTSCKLWSTQSCDKELWRREPRHTGP